MQSKLKIVLFTYGLPFTGDTLETRPLGGSETAFIYMGRALTKLGHEVLAFCACPKEGLYDGVSYLHLNRFEEWRIQNSCDLFICSRYYQIYHQPINARLKVLWMHDHLIDGVALELKRVLPVIDYVYCLSSYHAEYTSRFISEYKQKIRITSNGIDLELINQIRSKVRQKKHKIMFTSRPERGFEEALSIYQNLGDKSLEFLACSYPYPNEKVGGQYQPIIDSLNQQGFKISVGQFTKADLYQHIAESKVVIYPSNTPEIFCISAIEAQACGTVFLGRNQGALSETVGYPCQEGRDPQGFLRATNEVLNNEVFRAKLEHTGLHHVTKYSWSKVAEHFVKDYLNFVGLHGIEKGSTQVHARPKTENLESPAMDFVYRPKRPAFRKWTFSKNVKYPKISCLTVTKDRVVLLKQAVQCFINQTYPEKELIIVAQGDGHYRQALEGYIRSIDQENIRLIWFEGDNYSLGKARNLSLEASDGALICIWDDDDLYHNDRLHIQYQYMVENDADGCCLTDYLQFFEKDKDLFWVDWKYDGTLKGHDKMLPGSLLAYKKEYFEYPEKGEQSLKGEDNYLMDNISKRMNLVGLDDCGYLYVYRFHQRNVHPEAHHRRIARFGCQTSEFIQQRISVLFEALDQFPLPQPIKIVERGGNVAFRYMKSKN